MSIRFSDPKNPITGFMSNQSYYRFNLDEKSWKSVEHYVQAQKFIGTQLEEMIRNAPTIHQVKNLSRQRRLLAEENGKIVKKRVYGKDKEYYIREDWDLVKRDIMKRAMTAKFKQNSLLQKRLIETGDTRLVDTSDPYTGPILEDIREEFCQEPGLNNVDIDRVLKDTDSEKLSEDEESLIRLLISISKRVSEIEGWRGKIHLGMVEDSIYSLTKRKDHPLIELSEKPLLRWDQIYTEMPKFLSLVLSIQEMNVDKTLAIFLGEIILKIRECPSLIPNIPDCKPEKIKIRLLKKKREYRRSMPPKIFKTSLTKKEKRYLDVALKDTIKNASNDFGVFKKTVKDIGAGSAMKKHDYYTFLASRLSRLLKKKISCEDVQDLEEKNLPLTLDTQSKKKPEKGDSKTKNTSKSIERPIKGYFFVKGELLKNPHHKRKLLQLGGCICNDKIKFPTYMRSDVEDYLFINLSPEQRWEKVLKTWINNKRLTLLDTCVEVGNILSLKKIDTGVVSLVINRLYPQEDQPDSKEGKRDFSNLIKKRYPDVDISPESEELLVGYVSALKGRVKPLEEKLSLRDYLLKLDQTSGWSVDKKTNIKTNVKNLVKILSKDLKLPIDLNLYRGAFMILLPPVTNIKIGAKQYIDDLIKDIDESKDLKKIAEEYEVSSISNSKKLVLTVITNYLSNLSSVQEFSWLKDRIALMTSTRYTSNDIFGNRKALTYDKILKPLKLSEKTYKKVIDKLEQMPEKEILRAINGPANKLLEL